MSSYNFSSNVWWDNYKPKYFKNNSVADDQILKFCPFFNLEKEYSVSNPLIENGKLNEQCGHLYF